MCITRNLDAAILAHPEKCNFREFTWSGPGFREVEWPTEPCGGCTGRMRGLPHATAPHRRMRMPLHDHVVRLAKGANLATVVTLMPDGRPQA
jgi:hypothetical protein